MYKGKKLLAVLLALILALSAAAVGIGSLTVSAAEDEGEEVGYSWGTEITVPKKMRVGEVWSFYASGTYNNISNVDCKASTNGVISVSKSGAYISVKALKIGTAKMDVGVDSYYYGPNYSYDSKYDIVHYNITVAAPAPQAAAPTNVSIQNSGTGIYVSWNKAANAAKYRVYYKRASSNSWSWNATSNTYMHLTGLSAGEPYYIQVQSINADDERGGISKAISLTHVRTTTLYSTAYNSNGTVTVKWYAADGANGYAVAKKKSTDKNYTYYYTSSTSFTDRNVTGGALYYYQIRPYYSNGKSAAYAQWSNSKTITTLFKPTITNMNITASRLNVNWNAISGAKGYKVAFKRANDSAWNYRTVSTRYYNITNPTPNTTYYVQVCAISGSFASPWSDLRSIGLVSIGKTSLSAYNSDTRNVLSWSYVSGATGYQIAKKATTDSKYTYYTTSSTSYSDYNIVGGKTYTYQVRAYNGSGYGPWSNVASVTKKATALKKPVFTEMFEWYGRLQLEWIEVDGAAQYIVAYKKDSENSWHYDYANCGEFDLEPYSKNTLYHFQVAAVAADGSQGPWSSVYSYKSGS